MAKKQQCYKAIILEDFKKFGESMIVIIWSKMYF